MCQPVQSSFTLIGNTLVFAVQQVLSCVLLTQNKSCFSGSVFSCLYFFHAISVFSCWLCCFHFFYLNSGLNCKTITVLIFIVCVCTVFCFVLLVFVYAHQSEVWGELTLSFSLSFMWSISTKPNVTLFSTYSHFSKTTPFTLPSGKHSILIADVQIRACTF